ncbi:hypothetical protein R1flu_002656 [Riccia fluitans]|uniref:Uncharacterized protein n=1 Tax=Riccia fluitans TaxID=41844 RepID=A0ABD1Y6T3_9MARC
MVVGGRTGVDTQTCRGGWSGVETAVGSGKELFVLCVEDAGNANSYASLNIAGMKANRRFLTGAVLSTVSQIVLTKFAA